MPCFPRLPGNAPKRQRCPLGPRGGRGEVFSNSAAVVRCEDKCYFRERRCRDSPAAPRSGSPHPITLPRTLSHSPGAVFAESQLQTFGILPNPPGQPCPAQAGRASLCSARKTKAAEPVVLPVLSPPLPQPLSSAGGTETSLVPLLKAAQTLLPRVRASTEKGAVPDEGENGNGHSRRVNPLPSGCKSFPRLLRGFSALVPQRTQPQPCCSALLPAQSLINYPVTPARFFSDAQFTRALDRFWGFLPQQGLQRNLHQPLGKPWGQNCWESAQNSTAQPPHPAPGCLNPALEGEINPISSSPAAKRG